MARLTILADDLTGAADTGAFFAHLGLDTRISLSPEHFPDCDVLVLNSESRHLEPGQAFEAMLSLADRAATSGKLDGWVYKKIDSLLRGSPGEELAALMQASGQARALVCPAFPAQGRLTRSGCQHAPGFDPIHLPPLFTHAGLALNPGLPWDCPGEGVWIADTDTDEDLRLLVQRSHEAGLRLLCGSAGLARALAPRIAEGAVTMRLTPPTASRALIVAGSRSPVTARQVDAAERLGFPLVQPQMTMEEGVVPACAIQVEQALAQHPAAILTSARLEQLPGQEARLARLLAQAAAALVRSGSVEGLILTGGDIAGACCAALQVELIRLGGEICPGVAWGRLESALAPDLPVVTKAGAFGREDTLLEALKFLTADDAEFKQ